MRKLICAAMLLGLMLTVGCKPTIDTSSDKAFEDSVKKISDSLDKDQKAKFEAAMITVMMKHAAEGGMNADSEKKAKAALSGKSADDIISEAEKIDPNFKSGVEHMKKMDK